MTKLEIILLGGAIGLVAVALYKGLVFDGNAGIDPTTGGVTIAPGAVYGPPAPTDGTVTEGLA